MKPDLKFIFMTLLLLGIIVPIVLFIVGIITIEAPHIDAIIGVGIMVVSLGILIKYKLYKYLSTTFRHLVEVFLMSP